VFKRRFYISFQNVSVLFLGDKLISKWADLDEANKEKKTTEFRG
jgi:hypothetical protein